MNLLVCTCPRFTIIQTFQWLYTHLIIIYWWRWLYSHWNYCETWAGGYQNIRTSSTIAPSMHLRWDRVSEHRQPEKVIFISTHGASTQMTLALMVTSLRHIKITIPVLCIIHAPCSFPYSGNWPSSILSSSGPTGSGIGSGSCDCSFKSGIDAVEISILPVEWLLEENLPNRQEL